MNGLLKFITCGSVDDGKSTLIGHMLYDAKLLFTDQARALELDSRVGSREGKIDYSLLLDGLMAEREQGITIDAAYRYFTTEKRSFIVADTPGHEEYTRNMAVGASFADLAVILVDASQGILTQTRRHARICALMGIRHFVFAVNKMDLVRYEQGIYRKIEKEIKKLAVDLDLGHVHVIPVCATEGDNVTLKSSHMPWYEKETLLGYLETVDTAELEEEEGFVLPIQRVCRPNHTFRGFQGQIESGKIHTGDTVTALPSREKALVQSILVTDREAEEAGSGQAVTLTLDREIDVSRGCILVKDTDLIVSSMFTATILWMDDQKLTQGKNFLIKIGTRLIPASVMDIKYRMDINTGEHLAANHLYKNEIAVCDIAAADEMVYDTFQRHKGIGSFILIDRVTNMTSACGVVEHSLRRSENIVWQKLDITREIRAGRMGQKPLTLWFTGLSGSGKSALANELEKRLNIAGKYTMLLDGDNIRMGLNKNLGFEPEDRIENIRRIAEVARLMNDAGLIVLTAFISPFASDRQNAREIIGKENFIEIYVSTSLEECERRDVKGLYRKAREGKIPNFTGISSAYEVPERPEIVIDTSRQSLGESAELVLKALEKQM
ncbi:MAG: adenylyl-sulfate kinase [Lachnospiraceae bacterium]|jgi:bifunctional enzyme CysN/CysC|nr:adenylyl-sulfate kinase [Lachnospiraceae bacterium]